MRNALAQKRGRLIAFLRDRRGVSAVEFALVAPFLILTYFGVAELSSEITSQRRVSHAASAVGDLVAQTDTISDADMVNVFNAGKAILAPYATTNLKMRITSITGDSSGTPKVDWSDVPSGQAGLTALTRTNTVPVCSTTTTTDCIATGLVSAQGDNVIMAETRYVFDSPVKYVIPNALTFNDRFYLRPRKSAVVARTP